MWLYTELGFYSIVDKGVGEMHIRSRQRGDLERLVSLFDLEGRVAGAVSPPILATERGDYPWRLVVGPELCAAIVTLLATRVRYSNFKDRIKETMPERVPHHMRIWSENVEAYEGFARWQRRQSAPARPTKVKLTKAERKLLDEVLSLGGYEIQSYNLIAKSLLKKGLVRQEGGARGPGNKWIRLVAAEGGTR